MLNQFKVLPYGIKTASALVQHAMEIAFLDLLWLVSIIYIDDLIIHTHLELNLKINLSSDFKEYHSMKDNSGPECNKAYTKIERLYGKPKILLTNNADVLNITGVKHVLSSSYHPEANRRLERINKEPEKQCRTH